MLKIHSLYVAKKRDNRYSFFARYFMTAKKGEGWQMILLDFNVWRKVGFLRIEDMIISTIF